MEVVKSRIRGASLVSPENIYKKSHTTKVFYFFLLLLWELVEPRPHLKKRGVF
jgi:hypothetical protein